MQECNSKKDEKPGFIWIGFEEEGGNKTNSTKKGKPNFLARKSKKVLTKQQIEEKLEGASKRREERNQRRSQHAAQHRQNMLELASKIQALHGHDMAVRNGKHRSDELLNKKEYCKIAAEVSFGFENLSKKYENILQPTKSDV